MADKTVTVGSGLDHATLNAALAAEVAATPDLVTNTRILTISIEGSWSSKDTTLVTSLSGFTTNATYYVNILVKEGETAQHDGTMFKTNAYALEPSTGGHCITLDQENTRIQGLVIKLRDNPTNSSEGIRCDTGSDDSVIDKCIIWHDASDVDADGIYLSNSNNHVDGHTISVFNCIIFGFTRAGINHQCFVNNSDTSNMIIRNCTIWDCGSSDGESANIHVRKDGSTSVVNTTIYNTLSIDTATTGGFPDVNSTGGQAAGITWVGDYNACTTVAGDQPSDGANSLVSHTTTENSAPGAGDWIIVNNLPSSTRPYTTDPDMTLQQDADNDVLAQGATAQNPPSPWEKDIHYTTRVSPPDIGADSDTTAVAAFMARVTMF